MTQFHKSQLALRQTRIPPESIRKCDKTSVSQKPHLVAVALSSHQTLAPVDPRTESHREFLQDDLLRGHPRVPQTSRKNSRDSPMAQTPDCCLPMSDRSRTPYPAPLPQSSAARRLRS